MKCRGPICLSGKADVLSMPMLIGESSTLVPHCAKHFEADYKGDLHPMLFFQEQVATYLVAEKLTHKP